MTSRSFKENHMFTIGEFSLITRLPVKTLRFYHEEGILIPDWIDDDSGYRYYRESSVEKAMIITMLRSHEFSLSEIRDMLSLAGDDADLMKILEQQRGRLSEKASRYHASERSLAAMIETIRRNEMKAQQATYEITEKHLDEMIFAGIRYKGRYEDMGKYYSRLFRAVGRRVAGNALSLYYDGDFIEDGADIEVGGTSFLPHQG